VLDAIVADAARYLEAGGLLALEVGVTQAARVAQAIRDRAEYDEPRVIADWTGRPRIVAAECRTEQGRT
jgi:methylase of polypeptide subunit release factors